MRNVQFMLKHIYPQSPCIIVHAFVIFSRVCSEHCAACVDWITPSWMLLEFYRTLLLKAAAAKMKDGWVPFLVKGVLGLVLTLRGGWLESEKQGVVRLMSAGTVLAWSSSRDARHFRVTDNYCLILKHPLGVWKLLHCCFFLPSLSRSLHFSVLSFSWDQRLNGDYKEIKTVEIVGSGTCNS